MPDDRKYSRVYHDAPEDDRFENVWTSDPCLALWLRLLVVADGTWPAPAPIPRSAKARPLAVLVEAGLVELVSGDLYRIHGMNAERTRRSKQAAHAADVRWHSDSTPDSNASGNARSNAEQMPNRVETSRDETRLDEQNARDPWDDPEHEAVTWLAKHGVVILPNSGYYPHLVTMVEAHGVNAVVGMLDRLASAGTKSGDVKGFLFGARDALDKQSRPSLAALEKEDRAGDENRAHRARLERTQRDLAALRSIGGES